MVMRSLLTALLLTLGLHTAPLQAAEDWTCKVDRCTKYQSCLVDNQVSRCSYGYS